MHPCGLHFIIGKKGGGKSMLAVKMLTGILAHTNRTIVTNLPLHLGELKEYMNHQFPRFKDEIRNRVTIIPEARILKRFWLTLGNDWWIPDVSKEDWAMGRRLDYRIAYRWLPTVETLNRRHPITDMTTAELAAASDDHQLETKLIEELPPVQFIIDELQNIFAARNFLQTSPGALFWLSQQRHLGADFIAITQNIDLVDKEFRDLADDFLYLVNWGRKQKSFFRLPSVITWAKYDTKPQPGIKPMVTGMLRVDIHGLGELYDTSAGVGIEGGLAADTKEKTKGFHWAWIGLIILIIGYLLIQTPGCVHSTIMRILRLKPSGGIISTTPSNSNTNHVQTNTVPSPPAISAPISLRKERPNDYSNLVALTILDGKATAWFRDGTRCQSNQRPRWQSIIVSGYKPVGALIDGTNFYLKE